MKLLVTGAAGQLGYDVIREALSRRESCIGTDLREPENPLACKFVPLDITDAAAVESILAEVRPDVVVHCASWTAVDNAELSENRELVWKVNVAGTENIARACHKIGCKMIFISTDYVYNGNGTTPWREEDTSSLGPLNAYGESKLAAERTLQTLLEKSFIVRISWAFGKNGNNFVKTMLRVGKSHDEVRVVCDQIGTPTYTKDLSRFLVDLSKTEAYGIYHATNEGGYISWYDFCVEIYKDAGLDTRVIPVTTAEYGASLAKRPFNSRLDKTKLKEAGFAPLPDWRDALSRYIKEEL